MKRRVKSDEYSGHCLPVGAIVEPLKPVDLPDYLKDDRYADELHWYTQGVDGDERAIDPRDLEDLPVGYRWATAEETEANQGAGVEGAILVRRTFDAAGNEYTQDEADLAVPED